MSSMRLHFLASAAPLAQQVLEAYTCFYGQTPLQKADVMVVLGGDGTVIRGMEKALDYQIPVFGINCGHLGFWTNPLASKLSLPQRIKTATTVTIHPLRITTFFKDSLKPEEKYAFNDVGIKRLTNQSCKYTVSVNYGPPMVANGDGIVWATSGGSGAYATSAGARSVPLLKRVMIGHSICTRKKLDMRVKDDSVITIAPVASNRPAGVFWDNHECTRPISSCTVSVDHTKPVQVMFDPLLAWKKQHIR